jgi:hypothetical protein
MNLNVYEQIALFVSDRPNGVGRSDVAEAFNLHKNTVIFHLEKCARLGLVRKVYTWVSSKHRGWVYYPVGVGPAEMAIEDQLQFEQDRARLDRLYAEAAE